MKALLLLALVSLSLAAVVQVPLRKIEPLRNRLMREGKWQDYLKRKQQDRYITEKMMSGAVVPQKVNDYEDEAYVGNITIGLSLRLVYS